MGQLAVEPFYQGQLIGTRLMQEVERLARQNIANELALDTAEYATSLISWYSRMGYRLIEYAQWEVTNYRSVILSKTLA